MKNDLKKKLNVEKALKALKKQALQDQEAKQVKGGLIIGGLGSGGLGTTYGMFPTSPLSILV